jgi:HAD superfamily hydrolase (TIGR01509 family)
VNSPFEAVICDFDGVIADSEVGSNHALAESLTALGLPTSFEDCLRDYCGHNWLETERRITARLRKPLPGDFHERVRGRTRQRFENDFAAVPGVAEFLAACPLPKAIASSSRAEYLRWALDRLGLAHHFGEHLYSAEGMARGKPHPDIYLSAARGLGVPADRCLAIEDSPVGAQAAVAAGMTVVGLVAASHILARAGHAEQLRAASVHRVAFAFDEISREAWPARRA